MRIKQPLFYRQTGIRVKGQLTQPRLIPQYKLKLPLESIYHYQPEDTVSTGPSPQDPILSVLSARKFVEHVVELQSREGNPRRTVVNPTMLQNEYRRKTRGIRPLRKDATLLLNPRHVLVVNYAMLNPLYRYIPSFRAGYFRWLNANRTFWNKVVEVHKRFGWNQYIELKLPERLPTYIEFKLFERTINQKTLAVFSTPEALNLADFWIWLGDNRANSGLSVLTRDILDRINFVVKIKGYFFTINLGVLDGWRVDKDDEDGPDQGIEGSALQRRFLRLLQGLQDVITGATEVEEAPALDPTVEVPEDAESPAPTKTAPLPKPKPKVAPKAIPVASTDELLLPVPVETDILTSEDAPEPPEIDVPTGLQERIDSQRREDRPVPTPAEVTKAVEDDVETPSIDDLLTDAVKAKAEEYRTAGLMTERAYQRTIEEAETYKKLDDPYGSGRKLTEMLEITQEDLELPEVPEFKDLDTIPDKSMLSSKLKSITSKYVSNVLHKDVVSSVMAIQSQGVIVKDYKIEEQRDAMNHYQVHRVTLKPVRGRQSTIMFRLPVVDKDGRFIVNGTTTTLRTQRADIPIRKVSPSRVALTSYYNKTFVQRSTRRVNDFENWLNNRITELGDAPENPVITNIRYSNVFDMSLEVPRIYSTLAKRFGSFSYGDVHLYFDYAKRKEYFLAQYKIDVSKIETGGQVVVGVEDQSPILVDDDNIFYLRKGTKSTVIGRIETLLDLDTSRAPLEVAEMSVANKVLPLGFVLGYHLGLSGLIEYLGCEVNRFRRGVRINLQPDEYSLVFQDEVLVFSRLDTNSSMILAGIQRFHRVIRQYSVWDFDRKDVYLKLLEDHGLGVRYLREIESLFSAWMDPITRGLLEDMGEPTDFQALLLRAVELLRTDFSPEEVDGAYMRYRGYERLAGLVYGELSRAVKIYNVRAASGENSVEINPHAIWQKIVQDPAVTPIKESNPIQDLREQEAITYRGSGGRSGQSMVERTRIYHDSDVGVLSESTVDSGDVGVVAYLSPDANFTSLRGTVRPFDKAKDGAAKLLSTSALLAPASAHDDPRRINFIAIQQAQGIFADGYQPTPLRTGYEQVIAHRTTSLFATTADEDGEVVSVNKDAIVVKYKNGAEERVELGKRIGNAAGMFFPHELVTRFKAGDKIKAGDVIAYNEKFFTPDTYNPNQVVWKAGVLVRTALIDNIDTLEDGAVISERTARLLNTQVTEIRTIEVRFDQAVKNLIKVGQSVDLETILCTIEDPELADNPLFDEVSMDTLRRVSALSPRAKVVGEVVKVECFYHGDFEDMSPSLQQIAAESDRLRRRRARALGEPAFTGEVDTGFRIRGEALDYDSMAIQVYIDRQVSAGVGDWKVFTN